MNRFTPVKRGLGHIFLLVFTVLTGQEQHWNTTPFDRIWNKVVHPMMFRDPLLITPFDIRVGQFYYGGEDYWKSFRISQPFGDPESNGDFGIILDPYQEKFENIENTNSRKGIFIEVDFAKTNLSNLIYHQNVVDVQFGLGYRFNRMLDDVDIPWENTAHNIPTGTLKFYPVFQDFNVNSTVSFQRSPHYLLYLNHSIGYVTGSLYRTTGGESYSDGNGISETFSWGLKYIRSKPNSAYAFSWGIESRWGRILIREFEDPENISRISDIDLRTFGVNLTFSVNIGGVSTIGDEAFRSMMKNDYITSALQFESFLETYPAHGKTDEAEDMLDFCYAQIPYQRFREGLRVLEDRNYDRALQLLEKAQEDANDDLRFEIDSRLSEIANTLLDSVLNYYNVMGYQSAEKLVQRAVDISPKTRFRGDKVLAQMYFDQGNILYRIGNYEKALEKYRFAQQLDPDMGNLLNVKRKDLALGFLNDATKATDFESIYLVIESLRSAIEMEPKLEVEMGNIVKELESRLAEMDRREVQAVVDEIINAERQHQQKTKRPKLELGLLPHEVEFILGKPEHEDSITDNYGIRHDMWSYPTETGSKRLYFEDFFLVRIEED